MIPARRIIVALACLAAACASDGTEPITPQSLAITGGNQQTACFNTTLAESLEVTLTGSDNRPFPGAPVTWRVMSGAATLSPPVLNLDAPMVSTLLGTTDAAGRSRVPLSLGIAVTPVAVTATVAGLPPATFTAAGVFTPYALGQIATDALAPSDCGGDPGPFFDVYVLTLPAPQAFTASLTSAAFDAFLGLIDTSWLVADNDDSADGTGGTNAFLKLIAGGGTYGFVVASSSSAGETGAYTFATQATPVAADGCLFDLFVTRGITTNQEIATTDCLDASGPFYFDVYVITLKAGETITITESSTAFDAELFLCFDTCFASDDNSGGGTNARITHQAPLGQNQQFVIVPATKSPGETGPYTLTIEPRTAATSTPLGAAMPRMGRLSDWGGVPKSMMDFLRSWRRLGK